MSSVKQLLPEYEAVLVARGHRPRGVERYMGCLQSFAVFAGSVQVTRITPRLISSFQSTLAKDHEAGSLQVSLTALRSFFQWCVEMAYCDSDPTAREPWVKRPESVPRAILRSMLDEILCAINRMPDGLTGLQQWQWQRNRRTVLLLSYTGLRINEASELLWGNISIEARNVKVLNGKGGKVRVIPMHQVLVQEFQMLPRNPEHAVLPARHAGYPFKRGDLLAKAVFDRWLRPMGFDITAHQLRHTFATELLRNGADLESVRQLLGHSSLETTQRYLSVDAAWLQQTIDVLPAR